MEFDYVSAFIAMGAHWFGIYMGRKMMIRQLKRDKVITEVKGEYIPYQEVKS